MSTTTPTNVGAMLAALMTSNDPPEPLYDALREIGDGGHWLPDLGFGRVAFVSRYDDVRRVANSAEFSAEVYAPNTWPGIHDPANPAQAAFYAIARQQLIYRDPPDHTRLRRALNPAFVPRAIARLEPALRAHTAELLASWHDEQHIDAAVDLSTIPVASIATLMGIPDSDRAQFADWARAMTTTLDPAVSGLAAGEPRARAIEETNAFIAYLRDQLIPHRRAHPGPDLISDQLQRRSHGDESALREGDETLAQVLALIMAGIDTTRNLLADVVFALLDQPEELQDRLRTDPGRIERFREEVLRMRPPLHWVARIAREPIEIGGLAVEAGAQVWACTAAANRDPRMFTDPTHFDAERPLNNRRRHLAFGHGPHHCIGAPLARQTADTVSTLLTQQFRASPGPTAPRRRPHSIVARAWETVPATLTRR